VGQQLLKSYIFLLAVHYSRQLRVDLGNGCTPSDHPLLYEHCRQCRAHGFCQRTKVPLVFDIDSIITVNFPGASGGHFDYLSVVDQNRSQGRQTLFAANKFYNLLQVAITGLARCWFTGRLSEFCWPSPPPQPLKGSINKPANTAMLAERNVKSRLFILFSMYCRSSSSANYRYSFCRYL
jgi:hypothetical protein